MITLTEEMAMAFGAIVFGPPTYDLPDLADAIGVAERGLAAMRVLYSERIHALNTPPVEPFLRHAAHEAGAAGAKAAAATLRKRGRRPRAANGQAPVEPTPPDTPLFPGEAAA